MWIGLLDKNKHAYWPTVLSRVDGDLVSWGIVFAAQGSFRLFNRTPLRFHVHEAISCPAFYAFYRDIDDPETFYTAVKLFGAFAGTIEAGSTIEIAAGQLAMTAPMPATKEATED